MSNPSANQEGFCGVHLCAYAPQPNWGFNADANISHAFGIFMAYVGALQPSASGAG
jgi:hypothetical protein